MIVIRQSSCQLVRPVIPSTMSDIAQAFILAQSPARALIVAPSSKEAGRANLTARRRKRAGLTVNRPTYVSRCCRAQLRRCG